LRVIRIGDAAVEVRIRNQSRKANPNTAPQPALQALLGNLGVDAGKAAALSRAIVDWRSNGAQSLSGGTKLSQYQAAGLPYGPGNQLLDSVDDIGLVVGMTPALLARMKPFLSIYREGDPPAPSDLPTHRTRRRQAPATHGTLARLAGSDSNVGNAFRVAVADATRAGYSGAEPSGITDGTTLAGSPGLAQ
jgi:Type II secretion system (T2SS), protein K